MYHTISNVKYYCSFRILRIFIIKDLLMTVTANLNRFTETIKNVFPISTTQICMVHQIVNSCRYVVWKKGVYF